MKSSSEGPSVNVSVKLDLFDADSPEVAGVASERTCLDTETRTTRECLRIVDIGYWKGVESATLSQGMSVPKDSEARLRP